MSRFQDATSSWFMIGDDPEKLSGTIEIDLPDQPRWRWPAILMGAAALSAIAVGVVLLIGHHAVASTGTPPPLQIAVARTVPPPPPAPEPAPMLTPPPAAPIESEADEPKPTPAPQAEEPKPEAAKPAVKPATKRETKKLVVKPARKSRKGKRAKMTLPPPSHEIINGEKLMKQRRYGSALEQFQHLLRYTPDDVRALRGACIALDQLGRRNDAARVCRRALNLEPDDVDTRATLARIYFAGGAYQWSANEWRRVLSSRPNDPHARKGLRDAQERL